MQTEYSSFVHYIWDVMFRNDKKDFFLNWPSLFNEQLYDVHYTAFNIQHFKGGINKQDTFV